MDLDAKIYVRELGKDKYNGKSIIKNPYYNNESSINDHYQKTNNFKMTEFDEFIIDDCPTKLNIENPVKMNTDLLFTHGIELLEENAIEKKITKSHTIYTLPCTYEIEDNYNYHNKSNFINDTKFMFKGKLYDIDKIYNINSSTSSKLHEVCSIYLEEPNYLPSNIQKLVTNSYDGYHYYNLNHADINYYKYSNYNYNNEHEYEDDNDIKINNASSQYIYHKKACPPIYVKINQKGKFNITHLGFLGNKVPSKTFYKKNKEIYQNRRYCHKLKKLIHMYDSTLNLSYVKKIEIWFRGSKTKKWIFLKNVTLNLNGLTSCYQEDIIPIFDNFNDTSGLETVELKIIPLEYINYPSLRIAVYGNVFKETKNKTYTPDDSNTVNYVLTKINNSKFINKNDMYIYDNSYNSKNHKRKVKEEFKNKIRMEELEFNNF